MKTLYTWDEIDRARSGKDWRSHESVRCDNARAGIQQYALEHNYPSDILAIMYDDDNALDYIVEEAEHELLFDDNGDFNAETSTINALKAVYTDDTALPRYLTTEQLKRLYKDGDTLTDYINRVYDYMEI